MAESPREQEIYDLSEEKGGLLSLSTINHRDTSQSWLSVSKCMWKCAVGEFEMMQLAGFTCLRGSM